jgi:putative flippase GtrA
MIMSLAINQLGIHYFVSQMLATGIVLVWGFLGNRLWTFKATGKEHV